MKHYEQLSTENNIVVDALVEYYQHHERDSEGNPIPAGNDGTELFRHYMRVCCVQLYIPQPGTTQAISIRLSPYRILDLAKAIQEINSRIVNEPIDI